MNGTVPMNNLKLKDRRTTSLMGHLERNEFAKNERVFKCNKNEIWRPEKVCLNEMPEKMPICV